MELSKAIQSSEFNGHLKIVGYEFPAAEWPYPPPASCQDLWVPHL